MARQGATDTTPSEPPPTKKATQRIAKLERDAQQSRASLASNSDERRGPSGAVQKCNRTDNESAKMATSRGVIQGHTGDAPSMRTIKLFSTRRRMARDRKRNSCSRSEPAAFCGTYLEVQPYSRLVWTNDEGGEDGPVTTVTLRGRATGPWSDCERHPSKESLDAACTGAAEALIKTFDQLDELLAELRMSSER